MMWYFPFCGDGIMDWGLGGFEGDMGEFSPIGLVLGVGFDDFDIV